MRPIGYYAGFLSTEDQEKIGKASIANLAAGITTMSDELWQEYEDGDDFSFLDITYPSNHRDKLAVIRGICDAIELKLMEAAK
jgi:LPS sulfotransferase NodH